MTLVERLPRCQAAPMAHTEEWFSLSEFSLTPWIRFVLNRRDSGAN